MRIATRFAVVLCIVTAAASISAFAQSSIPRYVSYQGLLTDPIGQALPDSGYTVVLRLYDRETGGILQWEEVQTVYLRSGLFNVSIGAVNTLDNVDFRKRLWLELSILGSSPFTPRTPLSTVPHAIEAERAYVADSVAPDGRGFVRTLNTKQGDVTITGTGGIAVTTSGDTIHIDGAAVAGIRSVRNTDGSIEVRNPNGPDVIVNIAPGGVSSDKLAAGAVTTEKIANGSVTAAKLAPGAMPSTLPPSGPAGGDLTGTYPDPSVRTGAITEPKLADGAVTEPKLQNGSVTTGKLTDAAVTNQKLADGSVSTLKLQDASVTAAKLSATGVTPGTYGLTTSVPEFTIDAQGRVTAARNLGPLTAMPGGPAAGDLTGTYPAPFIAVTQGAGDRIVAAAGQSTSPLLNTPGNLVRLDAQRRLPIADGSQLYNLPISALTGVVPVANGGTGSGTALSNNRVMVSQNGTIVEGPVQQAGQVLIGGGFGVMPAAATLTPGPGIVITNAPGSITISNGSALVSPGTANDQTLRWDAATSRWVPNAAIIGTATGNFTANGTGIFLGSLQAGNSVANNTITGSTTLTGSTTITGLTQINSTGASQTTIGNTGAGTHGVRISAGTNGNIEFYGVDPDVPGQLLILNAANQVRTADPALLAQEGVVFQNGAFRLGATSSSQQPLLQPRFVNINNQSLAFTRQGGAQSMLALDALNNTVSLSSVALINTSGTNSTTIGTTGNTTSMLSSTISIGTGLYATQIGIGRAGNSLTTMQGQVTVGGTAQTNSSSAPNLRVSHLGGSSLTTPYNPLDPSQGILVADASGDMRKIEENVLFGSVAWLLGGNTLPSNNDLGTISPTDLDIVTAGTPRITISGTTGNVTIANGLTVNGSLVSIDNVPTTANKSNVVLRNGAGDLEVSNRTFVTSAGALAANTAVRTNASGDLESVALTNGQLLIGSTGATPQVGTITGTTNQVNVATGPGTITLSTPQNIHAGATPTFAGMTLSGLTPNRVMRTGAGGLVTTGQVDLANTNDVTGTLPVVNGGTGLTNVASGALLYGNGAGALNVLANPAGNRILVHNGTVPSWSSSLPPGVTIPFDQVTSGTNTGQTLTVGAGTTLAPSTGTVEANQLTSLAGNGMVARTASGSFTNRTITGTTNAITVTNGNGVSGDPTINLASTLDFTGKTITAGTYNSGTFNNSTLTGTISTPLTANSIVRTNGTGQLTTGQVNLASSDVTGTLPAPNGGTGLTSVASGTLLYGNGVGALNVLANPVANSILTHNGTTPSWSTSLPTGVTIPFSQITSGNNTSANMTVSGSATLVPSGTGTVEANQLTSLAGNGMVARTASGSFTNRTITGTPNEVTLTNGDGVAGNPTVSLPTALTFTGKTVTGGTFDNTTNNNGTFNSPDLNSPITTDLTASRVVRTAAGGVLTTGQVDLANTNDVTGTLPVANGGTGLTSVAGGTLLYGNGVGALSVLANPPGNSILVHNGSTPSWSTSLPTGVTLPFNQITSGTNTTATMTVGAGASIIAGGGTVESNVFKAGGSSNAVDLNSAEVAGTLSVTNGGTGVNTAASNGQLLIGNGTGFTLNTIAGTPNRVTVTNGAGTITLSGPQDIHTGASPQFAGVTITGNADVNGNLDVDGTATIGALNGVVKATAGVLSASAVNLASSDVTGTLPVPNGGTGLTSVANGTLLYGNGVGALNVLANPVANSILTHNGTTPSWSSSLPTGVTLPFNQITSGNNTSANMTVSGTATLVPSGTGTVEANQLTSLAGNGMVARTASGTFTNRTITGTTNAITITNGNGVSGDPTINLAATLDFTGKTITAGTYNSGTFNNSTLTGTISTPLTANSIVRTNGTGQLTTGQVNLASSDVTGTLPVANGGTGLTSVASGTLLYGNGVGALSVLANPPGNSILVHNGSTPSWSTSLPTGVTLPFNQITSGTNTTATMTVGVGASIIAGGGTVESNVFKAGGSSNAVDLNSAEVAGTLPVTNGGTGVNTAASNGQLLIGNGTGFTLNPITGTPNRVTVTNGAGTITLSGPQDIHTGASPQFAGATITGNANVNGNLDVDGTATIGALNGVVKATAGVLSASAVNLASSDVTGTLPVPNGGTGLTSVASGTLLYGNGVGALNVLTNPVANSILTHNGTTPSWSTSLPTGVTIPFNQVTSGTNAGQTLTVGAGSTLAPSTGTVEANQLTSLAGNGMVARTASGSFTNRTITGTANEITLNNGDGVAGNPTVSLPTALTFTGKTVTGGTFDNTTNNNGTFNSPDLNSPITTDLTASRVVRTAAGGVLTTGQVDLANTNDVTGSLPVANGGTGLTSVASGTLLYGNGVGALSVLANPPGNSILVHNGSTPSWSTSLPTGVTLPFNQITSGTNTTATMTVGAGASILAGGGTVESNVFKAGGSSNAVDLNSAEVAGTLPVTNGGTGVNTAASNGQLLIGNGSGFTLNTIIETPNRVTVTNGAGTITLSGPQDIHTGASPQFAGATITGNASVNGDLDVDGTATIGSLSGVVKATAGVLSASAVNLASSDVTGTLPVPNGGTGLTSVASGTLLYGNGVGALNVLANPVANSILTHNGTTPSWSSSLPTGVTLPFNQITSGNNTSANMTVSGTATLVPSGTGTVEANQLTSLSGDGMVARTASGTFTNRTITGTANEITLTNGDGVAGNPTVSLPAALTFTGKTVTGGTFDDGTFNSPDLNSPITTDLTASRIVRTVAGGVLSTGAVDLANTNDVTGTLPVPNGGTGLTSVASGTLLYGNGVGALNVLANPGANSILTHNGTTPSWSSSLPTGVTLPFNQITSGNNTSANMTVSGTATLVPSGTGTVEANQLTSLAGNGMVARTASGTFTNRTITGTANEITLTNGDGVAGNPTVSLPTTLTFTGKTVTGGTFDDGTFNSPDLNSPITTDLTASRIVRTIAGGVLSTGAVDLANTNDVTGTLPVPNGGTGLTSVASGTLLYGNGVGALNVLANPPLASNRILTHDGTSPSWASTLPSGVTIGFDQITTGTNQNQTLTVGTGSSLLTGATGTIEANQLKDLAADGIVVRTSNGSFTNRQIDDTPGAIVVTNKTGVSGNPTIDLDDNLDFTGKTITAGTFNAPTLNSPIGTNLAADRNVRTDGSGNLVTGAIDLSDNTNDVTGVLDETNGGTGNSSYVQGDMLYASGANTLSKLGIGGTGTLLVSTGTVPTWTSTFPTNVTVPFNQISSGENLGQTLEVGTGTTLASTGGTIEANAFALGGTLASVELNTAEATGTLPISKGGTGLTTAPANGNILIGNAGAWNVGSLQGTLYQVNVTPGPGTIVLSLEQDIDQTSSPTFAGLTLTGLPADRLLRSTPGGGIGIGTINLADNVNDVAGVLDETNGGTGNSSYAIGDMLYASGVNTLAKRTIGSNGDILVVNGGVPTWSASLPTGTLVPFDQISTGTNTTATMTLDGTATITPTGTGTVRANQLTGLTANGVVVRTSDGQFTNRTILGTANEIDVINGTGGTGDPTISLPSTIVLGSKTVSGGTFNNATLTTPINTNLGASSIVRTDGAGDLIVGQVDVGSGDVTGILPISRGGTGINTTPTNGKLLIGSGSAWVVGTLSGTTNQVNVAENAGGITLSLPQNIHSAATPTFGGMTLTGFSGVVRATAGVLSAGAVDLSTSDVTGTLQEANGGTGLSTYSTGDLLYASGVNALSARAIGNEGDILTVSAGVPVWSNTLPSSSTVSFSQLTGGTNENQALLVGDGSSLAPTGTGTITANDLSGVTLNGMVARTGANTFAPRTITGTTNEITITNGDGATGDPTISLPATLTFTGKTVTGGTFSGPTLNNTITTDLTADRIVKTTSGGVLTTGTVQLNNTNEVSGTLAATNGGTGFNSYTVGDLLYAGTTTSLSKLGIGAPGQILTVNGSNLPEWGNVSTISVGFDQLTGGTSTGDAFLVGAGSSLAPTGTGTITANNLSGVGANGIVARTGANTFAPRTITGTTNEIDIANGDGATGNPTISLPASLTFTGKTVTGGTFSGPTLNNTITTDLTADRIVKTTTGGVLTTGTVQLNNTNEVSGTLAATNGGTGFNSYTAGDLLYATNGTTLAKRAIGTDGQILTVSGGLPTWSSASTISVGFDQIQSGSNLTAQMTVDGTAAILLGATGVIESNKFKAGGSTDAVDLNSGEVAGTLPIARGGTGLTTVPTNGQLLIGNGTGWTVASLSGTANQISVAPGVGTITLSTPQDIATTSTPTFGGMTLTGFNGVVKATAGVLGTGAVNLASSEVTGILPVANGGTGINSVNTGDILYGNGTGYSKLGIGAPGEVLTVSGGVPAWTAATALTVNFDQVGGGTNSNTLLVDGTLAPTGTGTVTANRLSGSPGAGIIAQTVTGTFAARTIAAGSNISVTNGNGVSGDPTIALATSLNFTSTSVSGGTFTSPSLVGTIDTDLSPNLPVKTGASGVLTAAAIDLASGTEVVNTLPVVRGGTGLTTAPLNNILVGDGTNYVQKTINAGTGITVTHNAGDITIAASGNTLPTAALNSSTLRWNGTSWEENDQVLADENGNINMIGNATVGGLAGATSSVVKADVNGMLIRSKVDLSSTVDVENTLAPTNGGTGTNVAPTNGQVLIGNAGVYTPANLTAGTGISITPGAGSITIANTAPQVAAGTVGNSTLRWNGSAWVENALVLANEFGDLGVNGTLGTNGSARLGDAAADTVVINAGMIRGAGSNKFADVATITGNGTTTSFTISNTTIVAGSVVMVTLEDGTDTSNYTATVSAKTAGSGFNVRLSGILANGVTKKVNYMIINP